MIQRLKNIWNRFRFWLIYALSGEDVIMINCMVNAVPHSSGGVSFRLTGAKKIHLRNCHFNCGINIVNELTEKRKAKPRKSRKK